MHGWHQEIAAWSVSRKCLLQSTKPLVLKATLLTSSEITPEIRCCWLELLNQNPILSSPFFSPEFTQIVAAARDSVEVAVVEDGGQIIAIFPFERRRCNVAGPVGSFISDYHGAVCTPDCHLQPRALLRACGLNAWDFNHTPASQTVFTPFFREQHRSPIIDVSAGYDHYVRERREAGTEQIKKNGNLVRRLEREVGPLKFTPHSPEPALLETLLQWKSAQFRHNGWRDLFSIPWVRDTIEGIRSTQSPDFAGMLSVLSAGDKLVAMHFGMRSATVWHYWFPSYDPAFSKYSPGVILLLKMAEAAPMMGIRTIDLGCGEHSYKWRLMNGFISTASGSVEVPGIVMAARRIVTSASKLVITGRGIVRRTPIGALARRFRGTRS